VTIAEIRIRLWLQDKAIPLVILRRHELFAPKGTR
jgi:hypothetical protein